MSSWSIQSLKSHLMRRKVLMGQPIGSPNNLDWIYTNKIFIHASEWFQPPFVFDFLLFCGNFGIMFADCAPCTSGFAVQKGKALLVSWVSGNWVFWTQLLHDPVLQVVDPDPQIWCGWTLAKITRLAKPCQSLAYAQKEAVANKAAFKTLRKIILFGKACTTWDSSKRRLQFIRPSESIHLPHRINAHLHSRTRLLKPATIFTMPFSCNN